MKVKRAALTGPLLMLGVFRRQAFTPISNWTSRSIRSLYSSKGCSAEKQPVGFSVDYEFPGQRGAAGDTAMENEMPTDDDWNNLWCYQLLLTTARF